MSDILQSNNHNQVTQDPHQNELDEQNKKPKPKWSVKIFNRYIPVWMIILVIVLIIIAYIVWHDHQKTILRLSNSIANGLQPSFKSQSITESTNSNSNIVFSDTPNSLRELSQSPDTETTRKHLTKLFSSF